MLARSQPFSSPFTSFVYLSKWETVGRGTVSTPGIPCLKNVPLVEDLKTNLRSAL